MSRPNYPGPGCWHKAATVLAGIAAGLLVLGCSASAAPAVQPSAPVAPAEIQPTWTPVLTPDGNDAYIAHVCFDGQYVILSYASNYGSRGPLAVAYGGTYC